MVKNRTVAIFVAICLILGTVPFALGTTSQTSSSTSNTVYISALDVGAPKETANQEYVKITNKGTKAVSMAGFEISHFRLVSGLNKCFKSGLDKRCESSAKVNLFSEKVGFGFLTESGFIDTCSGCTDPFDI